MASIPTVNPLSVPAKRLQSSIGSTATTFQASDILGWDGVALSASDFGEVAYGAFRDANGTVLELFSFDPTTIASTNISFVKRGLDFNGDRSTEITANKLKWIKGTTLIEFGASFPQLYQYYLDFANNLAVQGASDASTTVKGIGRVSVTPASPSTPIFVGDNDPRVPGNAYAVDAGSNDTYVITLSKAPTAYAAGQVYEFKAATVNTGAATLNVNSLGAKSILRFDATALANGDIPAGSIVQVLYDGTQFRLLSNGAPAQTRQVFTSSGTWTKPAGLKYIRVKGVGGGGSGSSDNVGGNGASSGGGGAAYSEKLIAASALGATEAVTIGAGATPGNAGGNTVFGTTPILTMNGGGVASSSGPGIGGTATGGDINIPGGNGDVGIIIGSTLVANGRGGDSVLGRGAGTHKNTNNAATLDGDPGGLYGGGSSGGLPALDGSPAGGAPGSGAPGVLIIDEFY